MNNPLFKKHSITLLLLFLATIGAFAQQSDTVKVVHVNVVPSIDGAGNDPAWLSTGVDWQPINQVWMPWKGAVPSASDFSGKYKVVWNSIENLLYFLVEIVDDQFIDGFNFELNGPYGYSNYDVVEIFLDEDRSKGAHVFDNGTENAQNAFSYHISVDAPADNETTDQFTVEDLDGVNWSNFRVVNYAAHFPELRMKKSGSTYIYEFSLKVYDDSYPAQERNGSTVSDIELSRVKLSSGKIMGATIAYCDNDDNDGKRDHFFGSAPGKEYTANFGSSGTSNSITTENDQSIFNTCWMSANDYGVFELTDDLQTVLEQSDLEPWLVNWSPATDELKISIHSAKTGSVDVELYDLAGRKTAKFGGIKNGTEFNASYNIQNLRKGVYIVRVLSDKQMQVRKIQKF